MAECPHFRTEADRSDALTGSAAQHCLKRQREGTGAFLSCLWPFRGRGEGHKLCDVFLRDRAEAAEAEVTRLRRARRQEAGRPLTREEQVYAQGKLWVPKERAEAAEKEVARLEARIAEMAGLEIAHGPGPQPMEGRHASRPGRTASATFTDVEGQVWTGNLERWPMVLSPQTEADDGQP